MTAFRLKSLQASGGFDAGYQPTNLGVPGPRTSVIGEWQANMLRTWPTIYNVPAMGLGAMPLFALGYTAPTNNNQLSPYSPGMQVIMPGLTRTPFGG